MDDEHPDNVLVDGLLAKARTKEWRKMDSADEPIKRCGCGQPTCEYGCAAKYDEWLDAPDGDGWWWRTFAHDSEVVEVGRVEKGTFCPGGFGHNTPLSEFTISKWQRVKPHSPVPKPLPKSKQVTLTAKVQHLAHSPGDNWYVTVRAADMQCDSQWHAERAHAIQWVRDTYGIEPEVAQDE